MRQQRFTVGRLNGLHARPSAALIKIAKKYGCELFVKVGEEWKPAGIMNLLLLGAAEGSQLDLAVKGGKEEECLLEFSKLLNNR